jgi:hypothetical protein
MSPTLRLLACAQLTCLVLAARALCQNADLCPLEELRDYLAATQRAADLSRQQAAWLASGEGKERVSLAVAAGRLSLAEAVEEFRRLDRERRQLGAPGGRFDTLWEEDQWLHVLERVERDLVDSPAAASVRSRLREEFTQRFRHRPRLTSCGADWR